MVEFKPRAVQEHARQAVLLAQEAVDLSLAVGGVADELVAEVGEVAADLVAASAEDPHPQQRGAVDLADLFEAGEGPFFFPLVPVSGRSISPESTALPRTSTRYSLWAVGEVIEACSARAASRDRAKAMGPEAARSRRWTG